MLRRKKAMMVFNIFLVILATFALTYAYIRISEKHNNIRREIGEQPMEVIMRVQEGEKALIFLDFAARMAVYEAIYDLQSSGGISKTSKCGMFYGFNMWNSKSGSTCFVDSEIAKDSFRDYFVSNLVARVAAYPTADFVSNVPSAAFQRGASITSVKTVQDTTAATSCGDSDLTVNFTYEGQSGFYPVNGSRVYVPKQANCKGSYPLVVYLHGCMKRTDAVAHSRFGDGSSGDIIPLAKSLIDSGAIQPVIIAAPSQTLGSRTYLGVENSPCGPSLWGDDFDPLGFVKKVQENLPQGITVSSISFAGHSGAGCHTSSGIHKAAAKIENIFAVGQFDTCAGSVYGGSLKKSLGSGSRFLAIYSSMGADGGEQSSTMGITVLMTCPVSSLSGGELGSCVSDSSKVFYAFDMKVKDHNRAVPVGMEQFLKIFFKAGQTALAASSAG